MIRGPGTSDRARCARWAGNNCEHKSRTDEPPPQSKMLALGEVSGGRMDDVDGEDRDGMQAEEFFDMKLDVAVASPPGEKVEDDRH